MALVSWREDASRVMATATVADVLTVQQEQRRQVDATRGGGLQVLVDAVMTAGPVPTRPVFPDLSCRFRTLEFLTLLSETNLLPGAALHRSAQGKTVFEPLLEDVEGLSRAECTNKPVSRVVLQRLVTKMAEVAEIWLRDDVHTLAQDLNRGLHLHRMHVLRRVEDLVTNPRCHTAWSTLGLTVACLAEERRHSAGLRPLSVARDPPGPSPRMDEARLRLTVRVRVRILLHDVQMRDDAVREEHSLVIILWALTVSGLRAFVVHLNEEMVTRMARRDASAAEEIAMAVECRLLQVMQLRNAPEGGAVLQGAPQLLMRSEESAADRDATAELIRSNGCLTVASMDRRSEVVLAVIGETMPTTGWMLKSPYEDGLAVGVMSLDESTLVCAK
tara:strand:+ start:4757 stop:5923 length:1167 start_codon:yes stop_codon:yes gene_type:complete